MAPFKRTLGGNFGSRRRRTNPIRGSKRTLVHNLLTRGMSRVTSLRRRLSTVEGASKRGARTVAQGSARVTRLGRGVSMLDTLPRPSRNTNTNLGRGANTNTFGLSSSGRLKNVRNRVFTLSHPCGVHTHTTLLTDRKVGVRIHTRDSISCNHLGRSLNTFCHVH